MHRLHQNKSRQIEQRWSRSGAPTHLLLYKQVMQGAVVASWLGGFETILQIPEDPTTNKGWRNLPAENAFHVFWPYHCHYVRDSRQRQSRNSTLEGTKSLGKKTRISHESCSSQGARAPPGQFGCLSAPHLHPLAHCLCHTTVHTAAQRVTLFIVTMSPAPCPGARKRQITETLSVHSRELCGTGSETRRPGLWG